MVDFRIIILAVATFLISWLSAIAFRRSRENLAFSLFVLSVGVWSLILGIFYWVASPLANDFWGRIVYVAGSFIAVLFYRFSLIFTGQRIPRLWESVIFGSSAVIFYVYLFTPFFIRGIFVDGATKGFIYGDAGNIFDLYFDAYFIAGFLTLWRCFRKESDQSKKTQYLFIIVGTLIGLILSSSTNIILPWFNRFELLWAGPIGAGIWVAILTYGILRHRILDVRVIATEIFVSLMWLILFINIFIFRSQTELLFNAVLFLGTIFVGYLLIQSVVKEVLQREELERLTKNLAQANERLKELDQLKSEFVSLASHQLRSPLTIIRGYISMLLDGSYGQLGDVIKKPVEIVMSSSLELIKLVNDLLNISRIEAGKISYDFKAIIFSDIIKKVLETVREIAKEKNSDIQFNDLSEQKYVWGDEGKLYEVVMNILDNAIKYAPNGKIEILLKKAPRNAKEYLLVSCKDNGIGISEGDISKLFSKFVRSNEAKSAQPSGLGIGLYFVKKIVEDHGGRTWVESPGIGQGSVFFVELPVYNTE